MFCMRKCDRLVLSKKEMKITFAQKNKRKQKGEIEQKARKVLGMLKRGIKFTPTQPNIHKIYERLQQDLPATHL